MFNKRYSVLCTLLMLGQPVLCSSQKKVSEQDKKAVRVISAAVAALAATGLQDAQDLAGDNGVAAQQLAVAEVEGDAQDVVDVLQVAQDVTQVAS